MGRKKIDEACHRNFNRLTNNLAFGAKSGRFGEGFIVFCIGRLSELDHRSKRFVMCDLILSGMESSDKYSPYLEQLRKEFDELEQSPEAQENVNH